MFANLSGFSAACLHCRQRRVKCDKILIGCANCKRHGIQCVYSARRTRKSQKSYPETPLRRPLLPVPQSQDIAQQHRADSLGSELVSDKGADTSEEPENDEDEEEDEDAFIPRDLQNDSYESRTDATGSGRGRLTVGPNGTSHYMNSEKARQAKSSPPWIVAMLILSGVIF